MTALSIGITCFPTFGGSGIIATEIGLELARRGHQIHFICARAPWRFDPGLDNLTLHEVDATAYPLFEEGQYALALTSKLVEVATQRGLDLFHVHYAVPHATAGYLAKQILGHKAPKLVTTLHGTDITLVGSDRAYLPVTRFSIERSDGVTVPSTFLREATHAQLGVAATTEIEVISNFVDTEAYAPPREPVRRPVVVHSSNFRPLKRVLDVVRVFARVRREREASLVLIGDGPDRVSAERLVHELGLERDVTFLGKQLQSTDVLRSARVFLLPSESESFGLAALEAMSCGVPVVASDVGGVGEVVRDGECGYLAPCGDVDAMAIAVSRILDDDALHDRLGARARALAVRHFQLQPLVEQYLAYYRRVLSR